MLTLFLVTLLINHTYGAGLTVEAVASTVEAQLGSWAVLSVTIESDPYPNLEEISWYKGTDLISNSRYTVSAKGTQLNIALTRDEDYTTFQCVVLMDNGWTETAQITLEKDAESSMVTTVTQDGDETHTWTAGDDVAVMLGKNDDDHTFEQVIWYKGIYPITEDGRYATENVSSTQFSLTISSSDAGDNGDYAVVYKTHYNNDVDGSYKYGITEFTVSVLGNPVVTVTPATAKVTEGSDVTFTCTAEASQTGTYTWYKNDASISGASSSSLIISDVEHENAAVYNCSVEFEVDSTTYKNSNIAYLVINDDTVMEIITPFLLAEVGAESAVLSFSVTSRVSEEVSSDMVTWYKDSVKIESGEGITFASSGKQLIISSPAASDEGHYRVMVQLTTVTLEGSMQLAVTAALPSVQFSSSSYVGRTGEQLIFTIAVGGNPEPTLDQMEWYLNENQAHQGDNNIRFSDNYLMLYKSLLTEEDAGYVRVVVETSAGRTEQTAEITVIAQEDIQSLKSSENQIVGKNLQIGVNFNMMPLPVEQNVQWTRESEVLTDTDVRIEFYDSGSTLYIKDTQLGDQGTYRVSVNKADGTQATKEIQVSIKTGSEDLTFTTEPPDTVVDAGSPVTITCDISGTPSPSIGFEYKNGTIITNTGRFYITHSSLVIYSTLVTDTNDYVCLGDNGDSTVSSEFTLTVNQRISIFPQSAEVSAKVGGTAKLTAYITPQNSQVEWTREGVSIPESDNGHYDVDVTYNHNTTYRKEVLTVSGVQSSDMGSYEATASYSEGKYTNETQITLVHGGTNVVSITTASGDQEVYKGQTAQFSCAVSVEDAVFVWSKDGVNVTDLEDDRYALSQSEQELSISTTVSDDEGLYMCHVSSAGESDQASATLTVKDPISITAYPTHRRLIAGSGDSVELAVTVDSGDVNSQMIAWEEDDSTISGESDSRTVTAASSVGTTKYTVTASLTSWLGQSTDEDASVDIYVTAYDEDDMREAAIIQSPTDQTAILGSSVTFSCIAYGIPDPDVKWSNGSADMDTDYFTSSYTDKGVESLLIIDNVKSQYQGEYRCKADNGMSSIQTKSVYLEIIDPPILSLGDAVQYGVPGLELKISVNVTYSNPVTESMCTWTRNNIDIEADSGSVEFEDSGTTLKISSVETSDAGTYRFTIETDAGSATTTTTLEIIDEYEEPSVSIPQYHADVIALSGSSYYLKCNVEGKPTPKVTWKFNDTDVDTTGTAYTVQSDSALKIFTVDGEKDTGKWTCVGTSEYEGNTHTHSADVTLDVVEWLAQPFVYPYYNHKNLTVVSGDTLEANIEVMYRYQIRAHNIVWERRDYNGKDWKELNMVDPGYDNVVSFARNRRQLLVASISTLYSGQYRATVRTVAGSASTIINVDVISRVSPEIQWLNTINGDFYTINGEHDFVFNASVTGEPFPKVITWYKKAGQEYNGIRNSTINGQRYLIGYHGSLYMSNPDKNSAGFYKIQVTPENGGQDQMSESSVELIVKDYYLGFQTAPYAGGIKKIGTAITLSCVARGVPDPDYIAWYKGITQLSETSTELSIAAVAKGDKGDYYCVAENGYGKIYSPTVSLQIQYLDTDFEDISCYKEVEVDGESVLLACTNDNLSEGEVFTLKCNGPDGWPYPKTTWYLNDGAITNNDDGMDPTPNQYGDLIFPWGDPSQSGSYGCQVTNDEASYSNSDSFTVNVSPAEDTSVDNAKTAEWLVQPSDVIVAQHTPVTIACLVSSYPQPTYDWTFNGQTLQIDDGGSQGFVGSKELTFGKRLLTFTLIDNDAAGDYVCTASNSDDSKSATFKLQVATRPDLKDTGIFKIGYIGNETEIDLTTISGDPFPTIVWTFNGEGIQLGDRIKLKDDRILRIDPTQASDEGIYQATATNKAGSAQHALYLKIEERLEFIEQPPSEPKYVAQYDTAVFPCSVRGTPPPTIYKWSRQDHGNEPFNGLPARAYEDEDHSLVIPYAQTWDNGTYICNVTNDYYDFIWASGQLVVIEPPSIVSPPTDYDVNNFGDSATLTCKCEPQAVALEKCEIEFRQDGVKVSGNGITTYVSEYTSQLTISNVQEAHLGEYECYGYNMYGTASAFAYITKSNIPYIITSPDSEITKSSRSSVELECGAIGSPPINYVWRINKISSDSPITVDDPVDDTRMEVLESGSLLIDGADSSDSGEFTCYASNPYGQASVSTTVTVNGAPSKPVAPWVSKVEQVTTTQYSATVNIKTYEEANAVNKYILTATVTETNATSSVPLSWSSDNPYIMSNLESKSYNFSVVLQNSIEASVSSDFSATVDFEDLSGIGSFPQYCVENVQFQDSNNSLTWEKLDSDNTVLKYRVYYREVDGTDARSLLDATTNSSTLTLTFNDRDALTANTQYDFQVVPLMSLDSGSTEGLYSEPVRGRMPADSPETPGITGFSFTDDPEEIIVEFSSNWTSTAGILKNFKLYFSLSDDGYNTRTLADVTGLRRRKRSSVSPVTVEFAAKNKLITGLLPGKKYVFSLQSQNTAGSNSDRTEEEEQSTEEGVPGVCNINYLEGSGRDAIEVRWSKPDIENGEIQGYYVYYRLDNSFTDVAARVEVNSLTLSKNVTGLDEGYQYEFAVSAFTSAGEGGMTEWDSMTPRSKSIPNKMDTPVVVVHSWNTINVTWVLLDDGLTGIDTFTIYLDSAISKGGQSSYVIPNRNDRFAQINTLDEDISYALSMVATNNMGSSLRSNIEEFRTPKKPLYLRVWVGGMTTGIFLFLFLIFFCVLFYVFIYKKEHVRPIKIPAKFKKTKKPTLNTGPLVLGNPSANYEAERYSTRNTLGSRDRRADYQMREADPRPRHPSDNYSYNSAPKPAKRYYDDDGYQPSQGSYAKDAHYEPQKAQYDHETRHDAGPPPGRYSPYNNNNNNNNNNNRYDDDAGYGDNYNNKRTYNPRDEPRLADDEGFVIDNPAAARFSQI